MRSKISNRTVAAITVLIVALIAAESFVRALIRQIYSLFYVSITNITVYLSERICTKSWAFE